MTDKKVLVRSLVKHLKKLGFVNHLVDYINKEIPLTIFPIAKRRGLTINEIIPKTTRITIITIVTLIAHDNH
jgi:hypothetical protein